jgi:pimeloyl-ACP methyl ester carboxylesterase
VNGVKLAYSEAGSGAPIVFIHGAAGDYRIWDAQMKALSAKYHVIAISLRYHVPYEWPKKLKSTADYNLANHTADVTEALQSLKLGPVVLVGHSYGGNIAARIAAAHPELVRSLVLVEPFVPELLPNDAQGQSIRANIEQLTQKVVAAAGAGDDEKTLRTFTDNALGAGSFDKLPELTQSVMLDNARTVPLLFTTGLPTGTGFGCANVGAFKNKTALVVGEQSPTYFHVMADSYARCAAGAQQVAIPGAAHFVQTEAPDAFTAALAKLLESN